MILEKYFARMIARIDAREDVIKAARMSIAICVVVIFSRSWETTTRKPALVLLSANKAMRESIANEAAVNPERIRKDSLDNFWNDDAIAEDCEEVTAGRKPSVIAVKNPEAIDFMNSFLLILGNSVFCGGIIG